MRVSISFVLLTLAVIASSEVKTRPANEVARQNLGSLQEPRLMTRCDSCGSKSATDASTYGGSKGDTVVDSRSSTSADQSTPGSTPPASVSKVPGSSNADTQAATKKDTSTLDSGKAQAAGTATTDQAGGTTQADNKVDGTDTPSDTGTAAQTLDSQNSQNTSSSKTTANQSAANTVPGGLADQKSESTPDTQQTTGTQSTPSGATGRTQLAQSADSTSNNGAQYGQNNQQAIDTSTTTQSRDTTRSYQGLVESCQQLLPRFIRFTQIVSRPDVDYNSALQEFASIRSQFEEIVKTYSSCGGGCAQNQDLGVLQSVINQLIAQFSGWITAFSRWSSWSAVLQPHWQPFCNSLEDFVRLSRSIGINTAQVFQSYNLNPTTLQSYQINAAGFF